MKLTELSNTRVFIYAKQHTCSYCTPHASRQFLLKLFELSRRLLLNQIFDGWA